MNSICKKRTHSFISFFGYALLSLVLSACGGGGSSSESGNDGANGAMSFSGSEIITLSSTSLPPTDVTTAALRINISGSSVTITNANDFNFNGTLVNGSFTASGTAPGVDQDGVICDSSTLTYTGSVNGETITGTSRAELSCTLNGASLPIIYSTRFSVSSAAG